MSWVAPSPARTGRDRTETTRVPFAAGSSSSRSVAVVDSSSMLRLGSTACSRGNASRSPSNSAAIGLHSVVSPCRSSTTMPSGWFCTTSCSFSRSISTARQWRVRPRAIAACEATAAINLASAVLNGEASAASATTMPASESPTWIGAVSALPVMPSRNRRPASLPCHSVARARVAGADSSSMRIRPVPPLRSAARCSPVSSTRNSAPVRLCTASRHWPSA